MSENHMWKIVVRKRTCTLVKNSSDMTCLNTRAVESYGEKIKRLCIAEKLQIQKKKCAKQCAVSNKNTMCDYFVIKVISQG